MKNKRSLLKTIFLSLGLCFLILDAFLAIAGEKTAEAGADLAFLFLTIGVLGSVLEKENSDFVLK